jgi:hypothetical protein
LNRAKKARCLGALRRSDVSLDMEGKLDDPDYVRDCRASARVWRIRERLALSRTSPEIRS